MATLAQLKHNDPPSWPHITDEVRINVEIICSDQGKDADFDKSVLEDGRRFSPYWYTKKTIKQRNYRQELVAIFKE